MDKVFTERPSEKLFIVPSSKLLKKASNIPLCELVVVVVVVVTTTTDL